MRQATSSARLSRSLLVGIAVCCLSGGCATWSRHGVALDSRKVKVAVLPPQNAVPVRRLRDIRTVPSSPGTSTNDQELIAHEMRGVMERIGDRIEKGVARSYFFQTVPRDSVSDAVRGLESASGGSPPSADQLRELGRSLDADAVLIVTVSGYGKIKRKWFYALVGSGVAEGVVQGVLAAAVLDNIWAAAGVAAEEILQEALTWGGGTYLFNRIFTPVIIEADLVSVADGSTIWSHTSFARTNRKALKNIPKAERSKKEVRLKLTAERTADDLLESLDKSAFKNIRYRELEPAAPGDSRTGSGAPPANRSILPEGNGPDKRID